MSSLGRFKVVTKQALERATTYRSHKISNRAAKKTLLDIEKQRGKLSLGIKKKADAYANDVLGWQGYAPWLYVYSHISGKFKEGWIPDNYYREKVIPNIQGDYGKLSFLKPLNNLFFQKEVSPDIAYFVNGRWLDLNYQPLNKERLIESVFAKNARVIYKLDQSYQGKGVLTFRKENFHPDHIATMGNGVLQNYIDQHPFFSTFVTGSVATIRITTVVDQNQLISLRACYLRLGRKTDTHVRSVNHIRVPVCLQSGILNKSGFLPNWHLIDEHPDSKKQFSSLKIPQYEACVALVKKLHEKLFMVGSIGWDLTVDKDGRPVVMEWNGYSNDIKFSEATQGPCFKDLNWELLATKYRT